MMSNNIIFLLLRALEFVMTNPISMIGSIKRPKVKSPRRNSWRKNITKEIRIALNWRRRPLLWLTNLATMKNRLIIGSIKRARASKKLWQAKESKPMIQLS